MSYMKSAKITLSSVDFNDPSYKLSPLPKSIVPKELSNSISRTGILHLPILKEVDQGMYVIACGRKRLICAKNQLNHLSCRCHIIALASDPIETWSIIIDEIQQSRPLTAVEKAKFFEIIISTISIDTAAELFLPLMGLKPQTFQIKQLLKLNKLEEPIKIAIQNGSLDQKAAKELVSFSFRDRFALYDIINILHLSVGNQKKIISICKELQKRNKDTILAILSDKCIHEIINSGANVPQKATRLMKHLSEQFSPKLTKSRKDFIDFSKTLHLPDNATLSHSRAFENDSLTLQYYFDTKEQFLDFWQNHKCGT